MNETKKDPKDMNKSNSVSDFLNKLNKNVLILESFYR